MEPFSALLALGAGNSPVPVNSPHKGQWRGALMFSLICAWINDWVNNREAVDLRCHRGHYDVIVMTRTSRRLSQCSWNNTNWYKQFATNPCEYFLKFVHIWNILSIASGASAPSASARAILYAHWRIRHLTFWNIFKQNQNMICYTSLITPISNSRNVSSH